MGWLDFFWARQPKPPKPDPIAIEPPSLWLSEPEVVKELRPKVSRQWSAKQWYERGQCYQLGLHQHDIHELKALMCYEWAARQGHALACFQLGEAYRRGHTVLVNQSSSWFYYHRSISLGGPDSQYALAYVVSCYSEGSTWVNNIGLPKNLSKAIEHNLRLLTLISPDEREKYQQAVEQLLRLYERRDFPQDAEQAARWRQALQR